MPCVPAAQAVMTVEVYPFTPYMRLMLAAAMLGSIIGMKNGDILIPPRLNSTRALSSVVGKPPLPLPITTPIRSELCSETLSPASSMASPAAATAIWEKRAIRRCSLLSM